MSDRKKIAYTGFVILLLSSLVVGFFRLNSRSSPLRLARNINIYIPTSDALPINCFVLSPDQRYAWILIGNKLFSVLNLSTLEIECTCECPSSEEFPPFIVAQFDPCNTNHIIMPTSTGVMLFNISTQTFSKIGEFASGKFICQGLSIQAKQRNACLFTSQRVLFWNLEHQSEVVDSAIRADPSDLVFLSKESTRLLCLERCPTPTNYHINAKCYLYPTGQLLWCIPDADYMTVSSDKNSVVIWGPLRQPVIVDFEGHQKSVNDYYPQPSKIEQLAYDEQNEFIFTLVRVNKSTPELRINALLSNSVHMVFSKTQDYRSIMPVPSRRLLLLGDDHACISVYHY